MMLKPPHPKDVITNTLLRAQGNEMAQRMIHEFTALNGEDRTMFLFCALQDIGAEVQRISAALEHVRRAIEGLGKKGVQ